MRRALAIDEHGYGPNHPDVARDLNNLAWLLQATNRLGEAEPLMRRACRSSRRPMGQIIRSMPSREELAVLVLQFVREQEPEKL